MTLDGHPKGKKYGRLYRISAGKLERSEPLWWIFNNLPVWESGFNPVVKAREELAGHKSEGK